MIYEYLLIFAPLEKKNFLQTLKKPENGRQCMQNTHNGLRTIRS